MPLKRREACNVYRRKPIMMQQIFLRKSFLTFSLMLILGVLCFAGHHAAAATIKLATLAPKGSSWMNSFTAMEKELAAKTDGALKIRFYPNGVQGDELDVVRKMRAGLLHAGAMTATGLSEIHKEVLILQLPRMFKTYEELDYVRDALREELSQAFADAGYILLGWGDIGYYYMFSNQPIDSLAVLRSPSVRMWARSTDRIGLQFTQNAGIANVPQEVSQVLSALYSGQVNAVTTSPYACVALQWYPKLKYMTDLPVNIGVGATVITKETFDQLSSEQQQILRETSAKHHAELIQKIRKDNATAIEALKKKAGIEMVEFDDASQEELDKIAEETHNALVGEIYPQALLNQINALLREHRESQ